MCTVTYIPVKDKVFITSNRDEKNSRKKATEPKYYECNGYKLVCPKDDEAGGTWIALKENGDAGVLLNGAFIQHDPAPPYRKSRGLIFLDILATKYPSVRFTKINLKGIEPFTFILLENKSLYQFRWDGTEKFAKQLPAGRPHIWSSATLYDGIVIKKREQWFAKFLNNCAQPTQQDILDFHRFAGDGNAENDLVMKRQTAYATVSISSILLTEDRGSMKYLDIPGNTLAEKKIELVKKTTAV